MKKVMQKTHLSLAQPRLVQQLLALALVLARSVLVWSMLGFGIVSLGAASRVAKLGEDVLASGEVAIETTEQATKRIADQIADQKAALIAGRPEAHLAVTREGHLTPHAQPGAPENLAHTTTTSVPSFEDVDPFAGPEFHDLRSPEEKLTTARTPSHEASPFEMDEWAAENQTVGTRERPPAGKIDAQAREAEQRRVAEEAKVSPAVERAQHTSRLARFSRAIRDSGVRLKAWFEQLVRGRKLSPELAHQAKVIKAADRKSAQAAVEEQIALEKQAEAKAKLATANKQWENVDKDNPADMKKTQEAVTRSETEIKVTTEKATLSQQEAESAKEVEDAEKQTFKATLETPEK